MTPVKMVADIRYCLLYTSQYGLAHVPEGRRVFAQMSVQENLEMGAFISKDKAKDQNNLKKVFEHFPRLEERKKQVAGTLSAVSYTHLHKTHLITINNKFKTRKSTSAALRSSLFCFLYKKNRRTGGGSATYISFVKLH